MTCSSVPAGYNYSQFFSDVWTYFEGDNPKRNPETSRGKHFHGLEARPRRCMRGQQGNFAGTMPRISVFVMGMEASVEPASFSGRIHHFNSYGIVILLVNDQPTINYQSPINQPSTINQPTNFNQLRAQFFLRYLLATQIETYLLAIEISPCHY